MDVENIYENIMKAKKSHSGLLDKKGLIIHIIPMIFVALEKYNV